MLYFPGGPDRPPIIVLETENLQALRRGRPVATADRAVVIAWTPDPEWRAGQVEQSDGRPATIARLIDAAARRPQAPLRPAHPRRDRRIRSAEDPA